MMNFRDFKIGWRLLVQQPVYSIVVVFGLSIGFAACFLLLSYVRYSINYNVSVPQSDHVYLLEMKYNINGNASWWYEMVPVPALDVVQRSGLVESAMIVGRPQFTPLPFKVNSRVLKIDLLGVDPIFEKMLGVRVIEGDFQDAVSRPDRLALTDSAARKLFGTPHVLGQTVQINGQSFTVGAVTADAPSNSSFTYAALTSFNNSVVWTDEQRKILLNSWGNFGSKVYVKLKPGADPMALAKLLSEAAEQSAFVKRIDPMMRQKIGGKTALEFRLANLSDLYFDQSTANVAYSSQHGDRQVVFGLGAVGVLILMLAAINYVNLATVRALHRQREIALRKVLGASAKRLIVQFLTESLLVGMIATGCGVLLTWLLLPVFSDLVDRQIEGVFTPWSLLFALALGVIVSVASGAYPAWVAVHVRPPQTLAGRGNHETSSGMWLRRVLAVVQFSTAMALTGVTLAIAWQTYFASQINPGFDPNSLLVMELPRGLNDPASRSLRDEMARVPGVSGMAVSQDPVGKKFVGGGGVIKSPNGGSTNIVWRPVNADFFNVFGIRPLAGRVFDPRRDKDNTEVNATEFTVILNSAAVRALGYATAQEAIGQTLTSRDGANTDVMHLIGVIPDIREESLHDQPRPAIFYPDIGAQTLTVRSTGDLGELERTAAALTQKYFPDDVVTIQREQSYFAENYVDDMRLAKLLGIASLIALLIAAFGIYVLSTYNVQRLHKQIVLRKMYGASPRQIAGLVGREFITLIAIGALIGLPFAAVAIQKYLATFVEHAPIGGWTLMFAVLIALLVTFFSTLRHTVIAMRLAPVQILRD